MCRKKRPKHELVRVVRTPEGLVKPDLSGKANGRGAYLCPDAACWAAGVNKGRLAQALSVTLTEESRQELLEMAKQKFGPGA